MKTLYLNRHAKSSWTNASLSDMERPLNDRGHTNAEFMAGLFAKETSVDLILSSPAVRALTTAVYFAEAQGRSAEDIQKEGAIYHGGRGDLLTIINGLDGQAESAILFGHNPLISAFAHYLAPPFDDHLVTCSRVCIRFDVDEWAMISGGIGEMVYHHYPRMYPEMKDL